MKNILKLVISTASAATLTGCIDPANYATTPVSVTTETGTVVCQLYRTNNVLWDEAISIPPACQSVPEMQSVKIKGTR